MVKISTKQATELARAILESIEPYAQEHQEEFEQFLKKEQENKGECK